MLKIITDKALREVAERTKKKPVMYHFVCHGGNTVKMIDTWQVLPQLTCPHKGRTVWDTPNCKACNGVLTGDLEIRDEDRYFNRGVAALVEQLLQEHVITSKEGK